MLAWAVSPRKARGKQSSSKSQSPEYRAARNAGYIIVKDRNTVILYSKDRFSTPWITVERPKVYTIVAVQGLKTLRSWTCRESMHSAGLQVTSLLVACKAFMNAVDLFDQQRLFNPTMWREKRVFMSLLTFALDTALQNAFIIAQRIEPTDVRFVDFKRRVDVQIVTPRLQCHQNSIQRSLLPHYYATHYLIERVL